LVGYGSESDDFEDPVAASKAGGTTNGKGKGKGKMSSITWPSGDGVGAAAESPDIDDALDDGLNFSIFSETGTTTSGSRGTARKNKSKRKMADAIHTSLGTTSTTSTKRTKKKKKAKREKGLSEGYNGPGSEDGYGTDLDGFIVNDEEDEEDLYGFEVAVRTFGFASVCNCFFLHFAHAPVCCCADRSTVHVQLTLTHLSVNI
jgi:hypothetical protein